MFPKQKSEFQSNLTYENRKKSDKMENRTITPSNRFFLNEKKKKLN